MVAVRGLIARARAPLPGGVPSGGGFLDAEYLARCGHVLSPDSEIRLATLICAHGRFGGLVRNGGAMAPSGRRRLCDGTPG